MGFPSRIPGAERLCVAFLILALAVGCGAADPDADGPAAATVGAPEPPPAALPEPPAPAPLTEPLVAAFLIVDGVYNTELTAPYDVLQHTIYQTDPNPGIEVFTVSPDGKPVTTAEGLKLIPRHSFLTAPPIDILVVPSAEHSRGSDLENEEMIAWVRQMGGQADYVMSLCWGAFVLAEAGLLDGKAATTFPSDTGRLAETFPAIDVREGVSFVHDGPALTSQGGAKSFDVAMYLTEITLGRKVAQGVGGGLILTWPPPATPGETFAEIVGATERPGDREPT